MSEFCHLHCHSEYSLLDGMSRLEDMVLRAKELNQPAIALTDHGVMFGAIEFYGAAKKHGIKPIMGVEAYMAQKTIETRSADERRPFHMLLLAQNQAGYQNLLKLSSIGQLEGFYQKPRIDRDILAQHAAGVIATTGCLAAEVPRTLIKQGEAAAYEKLKWYLDVFGRERFFLELQGHNIPDLRKVNHVLLDWSRKHEVGLVATNDVHYVGKDDAGPHEVLLCMQTHDVLTNPKRMQLTPHGSYYITSTQEMASMFGDFPDALKNTIRIAEMCEVDLDPKGYHLPIFPVPDGYDAHSYLVYLVEKGLVERYGDYRAKQDPVVRERIERELRIIHNMGFDTYFLIVWDLCQFAASSDIWWNVRGSGAGSVVAYTLRITNIDPIKNDLIFERFLNPDRVSMPDFDLDFPDDRRHLMIEYAVEKYGKEKCAAIITFGTLGAKAAVRDVGRTLGMETNEINRLAQMIPSTGKVKLKKVLFDESGLEEWPALAASIREKYKEDALIRKVLDTAMKLEGQTRHASTHAAGIVISDKPIVEYAPLHRSTKGDDSGPIQQVVQFDMNIVESIGLLKVDFLGLATLAVMRRACEHIAERHGRDLNLNNIPYERNRDDPEYDADLMEAYKLLQRGETVGVFQVESDGLRRVLQDMLPDQFEHIIAAISLYRPGPLEYIPTYIERMHGREEVAYHHKLQEPILKNTYGICVSGDAIVIDAQTGQRYRLDEVGALSDFMIQGVDETWQPAVGHVTHWIDSGHKPVYEVTLRNGASIKVTEDHRLLTEEGWQPLKDIKVGGYIGTPPVLYGAEESKTATPQTSRSLNVVWQEVLSIEPAGVSHVYDLTVEGLHSFVANQIIVHNCVYQEQIMRMASDIAGYSPGEADLMRRAVSKKKEKDIEKHKQIFIEGAAKNGVDRKSATRIYEDIEYFARYGFNKCLPGNVEVIDAATGRVIRVADLYEGNETLEQTVTCDIDDLTLGAGYVSNVMDNGIKPVFAVTTALGRTIEATANHPFYTFDGWRNLSELKEDDLIAVPRSLPVEGKKEWPDHELIALAEQVANDELTALPAECFLLTNQQMTRLLAHLWRTCGTYLFNADFNLVSKHERLARQLQHLLLRLDLVASLNRVEEGYQLRVIESSQTTFAEQVLGYMSSQVLSVPLALAEPRLQFELTPNANSDIYWDRIVSIEYVGEKQTYDLEVPGTHNFIANDILVHNSHAADYAVITVQTAYLKAHYPVEYLCALLEVEFDDTTKVPVLINECRRLGIDVLPPDINASGARFTIEQNPKTKQLPKDNYRAWAIRVGLGAIKSVGLTGVESLILAERKANGSFKTLDDFAERVNLRLLKRSVVKNLALVGSFDELVRPIVPDTPREVVAHKDVIDRMMGISSSVHEAASIGQLSMFDMMAAAMPKVSRTSVLTPLPEVGRIDPKKRLDDEKELLGIYISEHPLQQIASQVGKKITHFCSAITEELVEQRVVIAGLLVSSPRVITTKNGQAMAFIKLEDLEGQMEVVVFPRIYEQSKDMLIEDKILLVRGKVNLRNDSLSVRADQIEPYQAQSINSNGTGLESDMGEAKTNGWHVNGNGNGNGNRNGSSEPEEKPQVEQNSPSMLEAVQYHITLTMQRTENDQEDLTRLERVILALKEHQGRDKFSLRCIIPDGNIVKMEFSELTISWNAVLKDIIDSQNMQFHFKDITPSKKRNSRKKA